MTKPMSLDDADPFEGMVVPEKEQLVTKESFSEAVKEKVLTYEMGWIEAVISYCTEAGVDYEMVPKLLTREVKERIEAEGISMSLLKKPKGMLTGGAL